jgi:VWFA-related protein
MGSQRLRDPRPAGWAAPALAVAALLTAALLRPAPLPAQEETFEGGTAVTLVEVPVTVVHHGEPLDHLTADDFELYDRGERQEIRTFERIAVDPHALPERVRGVLTPSARAARRNFLFLFDLAYSDTRRLRGAATALEELFTERLSPSDRVGIAFFSGLHGFQWVIGLTDRREDAATALHVVQAVIDSDQDRARELLAGWTPGHAVLPADARPDSEELLAEARVSGFNRNAGGWPTTSILRFLVRGLTGMTQATAGLDGRKYLVHLSYGLPDRMVSGGSDERARVLDQLQEIKRACRTSGWAIQSVNLAGLGWGRDSLLMMAEDTGGQLFTNSNDLGELMDEVEASTRVSYVLGFQPEGVEPDGRYHKLDVRLRDAPRGARIVHRPGYYAR